jgi:tripeptidyl-peptidase-1
VSDPKHESYGQYMSIDELTDLVAPAEEDLERVTQWVTGHGLEVQHITKNRDFVHVTAPVHKAEKLLAADFRLYQHSKK